MLDDVHYDSRIETILAAKGIPEKDRLYRVNDGLVIPGTRTVHEAIGGFLEISKLDMI